MLAINALDTAPSDWIAQTRLSIDAHLDRMLGAAQASPVVEAMRYSVLAPGKRIRPLLTLAVADFLGGAPDRAMPVACAIEMIHCASLILDDLPCMDNDRERRSRLSTHAEYGESLTILAAVSLLTQSHCIIASREDLSGTLRLQLIRLLCETVGHDGLSLGQYIDLESKSAAPSAAAITDTHQLKTGVLFLAAAKAGCLLCDASPAQEEKILRFTTNMGLAFQLLDDLKDAETDGTNMVARIGVSDAKRKVLDYLHAANDAIAGERHGAVLRSFIHLFFQKAWA